MRGGGGGGGRWRRRNQFAFYPCRGVMLIFSASFQF